MEKEHKHITEYHVYAKVLIVLLLLTGLTITVTWIDLSAFTVGIALIIATVKVAIVLAWFMHLKFDDKIFGLLTIGVLLLFVIIIVITFIDYLYR